MFRSQLKIALIALVISVGNAMAHDLTFVPGGWPEADAFKGKAQVTRDALKPGQSDAPKTQSVKDAQRK